MDRHAYPAHADMLDQAATSELERTEVRRILGARPLWTIGHSDASRPDPVAPPPRGPIDTPELLAAADEPRRLPCGIRRHAALPLERLAAIAAVLLSAALVVAFFAWLVVLFQRGLQ